MKKRHRSSLNNLIKASGKLKKIKRTGWYAKAGIQDCETVAEHSYRTALLAAYFASARGLDSGKASRMALLHDLAESIVGDLMPEQKQSKESHRQEEMRVLFSLLTDLPSRRGSKLLLDDARELFEAKSKESKLVWEIDKFEMVLQQREYIKEGYNREKLKPFGKIPDIDKRLWRALMSYLP